MLSKLGQGLRGAVGPVHLRLCQDSPGCCTPGEGLNSLGLPPSDLRRERDWHASRSGAGGASCPRTPSAEHRSPPWGQRWLRSDPVPVHLAPRPRAPREACDTSQSIDLCLHDHVSTVMPPTHGWQSVLCRLGLRKWCVIEVDA